jgi:4-amino-4-deoxy-L-arabinose transferase-like glycosyltransferase
MSPARFLLKRSIGRHEECRLKSWRWNAEMRLNLRLMSHAGRDISLRMSRLPPTLRANRWSQDRCDRTGTVILVAFATGLVIRLAILASVQLLGTPIVDEQHYVQLAASLLQGHGFAWGPGRPTSIRPPLFPGFVAAIWTVSGIGNLQAVRAVQVVLSLLTAWLVYLLGRRAFNRTVGVWAAVVCWLYPSLIFFNVTILTETLFTLLLVAFVLLTLMVVQQPRPLLAIACGALLGLAALTRSIVWPVPLLLCPLLGVLIRQPLRVRFAVPALVLAGYAAIIAPWAIRNTRLQGVVTVIDTMGGLNLRAGNYEHTPEDRMWDPAAAPGELNWTYALNQELGGQMPTEGQKDK